MDRTTFAGLTQLEPLEPLSTDDYSFQAINPTIIDRLLQVGAVTHRHDAHAALSNPAHAPSAFAFDGGGTIPADQSIEFAYTCIDADGGETAASPIGSVTTRSKMQPPSESLVLDDDYTAGSLPPGAYYYGATWLDGSGGETTIGPIGFVLVESGHLNARVLISNLTGGMATASAAGWKLYKSFNGSDLCFFASGTADSYIDDAACTDALQPPPQINTTQSLSSVEVDIPTSLFEAAVVGWKLYATVTSGEFDTFSLVGSGSPSDDTTLLTSYSPTYGKPPARNLSISGASKINPETDIANWHWRTPVADYSQLPGGSLGDVKLVTGTGEIYGILTASTSAPSGWTLLSPSGTVRYVSASGGTRVTKPSEIIFEGAGGAAVAVTQVGGSAKVTVTAGGGAAATGSDIHIGGSAGSPIIIDNEYVEFRASGSASVAIQDLGGGSAAVLIGTRPYPRQGIDIGGSGGVPTYYRRDYLEFVGSGGGIVGIEDMGGGSARVVVAASGAQGPPGAAGATGAQGTPGDGTIYRVAGSGNITPVLGVRHLEFQGSGGAAVRVLDMGGGSAAVQVGVASAARHGHTFALMGDIAAFVSPHTNAVSPYFATICPNETAKVLKMRHKIGSGAVPTASAHIKLRKNGSDMTGFQASATMTSTNTNGSVSVVDDDLIELIVTAVGGSPENLSVTVTEEVTHNPPA